MQRYANVGIEGWRGYHVGLVFISQYVMGFVAKQNVITFGTVNCLYCPQHLKVTDYFDMYGYNLIYVL
jgi:hypothetical protein